MTWAAYPARFVLWLKMAALLLSALFTASSGIDYVRIGFGLARRRALKAG